MLTYSWVIVCAAPHAMENIRNMVQHASRTVFIPHTSLSFAMIIKKPVDSQLIKRSTMMEALTVVRQKICGD